LLFQVDKVASIVGQQDHTEFCCTFQYLLVRGFAESIL
jgi:hypothetical protein